MTSSSGSDGIKANAAMEIHTDGYSFSGIKCATSANDNGNRQVASADKPVIHLWFDEEIKAPGIHKTKMI